MRTYLLLLVAVTTWRYDFVETARKLDARSRLSEVFPVPVGFSRGQPPEKRSREKRSARNETLAEELLGLRNEEKLDITQETVTVHGTILRKMKERYGHREVFDTVVTVKIDEDGETLLDASGTVVLDIGQDVEGLSADLPEEDLYAALIRHNQDENITDSIGSRKIKYDIYVTENETAIPMAIVEYLVETEQVTKRPMAIINSRTGEIIKGWDNLQTCFPEERKKFFGGNKKVGKREYGIIPQCLEVRREGDTCFLENDLVRVVDMDNKEFDNITETASFDCDQPYNDSINDAYSPALDALYFGTVTQRMFSEWFGHKLVEDLVMRVHYSKNHPNAFWNGYNVSFGDGRKHLAYPFVCLDITAHEISHGFTERNSGLLYFSQTGGVNEAFSDMVGEMAELYIDTIDWRVGYDIMVKWEAMRFIDNPPKNGRAVDKFEKFIEGMDPHACSGIFSKPFYLLCTKYADDPRDVFRVFLHANKLYWHPLTDFTNGACDVMKSAYDLGQDSEPFRKAFGEVGIPVCDVEDHIVHLRHNKTRTGVSVSRKTKPLFAFEVPEWSSSLYIEATSDRRVDIHISLYNESWDRLSADTQPLAEDDNYLEYNVTGLDSLYFYVRLSTSSPQALPDVTVRSGYFCLSSYTHRNFLYRAFYSLECFGIDLWGTG